MFILGQAVVLTPLMNIRNCKVFVNLSSTFCVRNKTVSTDNLDDSDDPGDVFEEPEESLLSEPGVESL